MTYSVEYCYAWEGSERLVKVEILNDHDWREVAFSYDALGRRTEKTAWRAGKPEPQRTVYEWSGMRLCGEHNEKTPSAHTLYLYEEESWQPLARVDSYSGGKAPQQRVLYYHTLPNGFPQCMTDSEGQTVWRARMWLWGKVRHEDRSDIYSMYPEQNLRFAGQYLDRETGLHYNTLRYFLPENGRFSQPDPVGLAGGINLYAYAPNPLSWIDPLGLARKPCKLIDGVPQNPGIVRRFMSKAEFKDFMKNGFKFNRKDPRGGISVTSVKIEPKNPDAIKRSTGALGADYYADINTTGKKVVLKGQTKGGVMDWKIKGDVDPGDVVNKGPVRK